MRNMPESPRVCIDLTLSRETLSVTLHLRYGILGMFLTLVTTNITVITIVGHKNLTNVSTKKTQFLLKRRQEEDYQLVLLPG
jgi:hypothetical protein